MTLIVSLRIPDGIVIAGDSLASMMAQMVLQTDVEVLCPDCGHKHIIPVNLPAPPIPATTFSFAQKIFPFLKKYGIGTYGLGMLLGKSTYYIVREFEQTMSANVNLRKINGVTDVANEIGKHIHDLLRKQLESEGQTLDMIPNDATILGFQVVGYDKGEPKTIEVNIGKTVTQVEHIDKAGCTISGQPHVSQAIWSLYKNPTQAPAFNVFSLQDAIAYAEFLINTTAAHQQFSQTMPNVGGEIDIALVTPFNDFQWIRQKPLAKLLGESYEK
jgi:hypothetical protein